MEQHAEDRLEAVPSTGALTPFDPGSQTAKTPHLAGRDWCEVFCREIDGDYSTPPAFSFRVLYSSQPRFHGFRLPDKSFNQQIAGVHVL